VAFRDRLDDRQAEPAARRCSPGATVEAIEHPLALRRWNARTVVAHRETRAPGVTRGFLDGHVDPAAGGGVTHGVVHQVAQQRAQGLRIAMHAHRLRRRDAQVDAARIGERHELGYHLARQVIEAHRHGLRLRPRLLAGERQHLFDEADGALHTRRQGFHRRGAFGVPARPREHAHL
jgi:hypothetical protein